MQITAQLNHLRIAPRKVRLVAGLIKGMDVAVAEHQLLFLVKRSSGPLAKLLKSAVANAENNFGLLKDNLYIKDLVVNEGVKIKRFMPRAMGQASMIQRKSSHIKITLDEKVPGLKHSASKAEAVGDKSLKPKEGLSEDSDLQKQGSFGAGTKKEISKKGVFGGVKDIGRKLFRRKSI
ncbi:MAG: 50S ribosomal protein L22 [Candidatus Yanofskybacteria bacterium]|nr:50S ribosomal protein L22 [Candidatus Yanofskybacteria bacterium]